MHTRHQSSRSFSGRTIVPEDRNVFVTRLAQLIDSGEAELAKLELYDRLKQTPKLLDELQQDAENLKSTGADPTRLFHLGIIMHLSKKEPLATLANLYFMEAFFQQNHASQALGIYDLISEGIEYKMEHTRSKTSRTRLKNISKRFFRGAGEIILSNAFKNEEIDLRAGDSSLTQPDGNRHGLILEIT